MLAANKLEFCRILNGLATIKPGVKLTAEGLDLYWLALATWSIEDFRAAAAELARTSEFFPNPYHFEQLRKAGQMSSGEAFAIAQSIARDCSSYSEPTSGHPRIDAAAHACGGYRAMGMAETGRIGFLERRFCEHFDDISEREDIREALPQIAGPSRARVSGPRQLIEIGFDAYNEPRT